MYSNSNKDVMLRGRLTELNRSIVSLVSCRVPITIKNMNETKRITYDDLVISIAS